MVGYLVEGVYNGKKVDRVSVDTEGNDKVVLSLYCNRELVDKVVFTDREGYLSILFRKRDATTARKYIQKLGLKIVKRDY